MYLIRIHVQNQRRVVGDIACGQAPMIPIESCFQASRQPPSRSFTESPLHSQVLWEFLLKKMIKYLYINKYQHFLLCIF